MYVLSRWSSASHVDPSRSNVALLHRSPSLTLSSPPVGVPQVTVAPMDVTAAIGLGLGASWDRARP